MARNFTYQQREDEHDNNSALKTVTMQYDGPSKILLVVEKEGKWSVDHFPVDDGDVAELPENVQPDEESKYILLDETNDNHVILMDMIHEKRDMVTISEETWKVIATITLSDGYSYTFRQPIDTVQNTADVFDVLNTTVDWNGVVNYVRHDHEETEEDALLVQIDSTAQMAVEKIAEATFIDEKRWWKRMLEVCEIIKSDMIGKYSPSSIAVPTISELQSGKTDGDEEELQTKHSLGEKLV